MTEGITIAKLDNLNWWQIWMMRNCKKKQKNTIKTRTKAKLITEVFEVV